MGPVAAIRTCLLRKPVSTRGRGTRSEFWWWTLFSFFVGGGLLIPSLQAERAAEGARLLGGLPPPPAPLAAAAASLALFLRIPDWAATARRLQDTGLTGRVAAPVFLLEAGFSAVSIAWLAAGADPWYAETLARIEDFAYLPSMGVIVLMALCAWRGTRGPNAFGPDPRNPSPEEVFA